jgi:hypothetical protein
MHLKTKAPHNGVPFQSEKSRQDALARSSKYRVARRAKPVHTTRFHPGVRRWEPQPTTPGKQDKGFAYPEGQQRVLQILKFDDEEFILFNCWRPDWPAFHSTLRASLVLLALAVPPAIPCSLFITNLQKSAVQIS